MNLTSYLCQVGRGAEDWPSMDQMLAAGKRVLLLSGVNYGAHMEPLIFKRYAL